MMSDARSLAQTTTTDDPTPTPPEGIPAVTRYFGLVSAPSLALNAEQPFVVSTLAEARELVAAIGRGGPVRIREWVHGVIVESDTAFVGENSVEMMLYQLDAPPHDADWGYPDYSVKLGPRGGVSHERL